MKILFLAVYEINDSNDRYIYGDLVREFAKKGHEVYALTPTTSEESKHFVDENGVHILRVKNGQIQKTSRLKKIINLLLLDKRSIKLIKKNSVDVKFDLIITIASNLSLLKTATYFKKRDNANLYLLMKDIFPQNAVDIGLMPNKGIYKLVYKYFRFKERKFYKKVDVIGCMSDANVEYLLAHNDFLSKDKVEVCPNAIDFIDVSISNDQKIEMRKKYGLPLDKKIFVYGGNLGKPQGIDFIIECLKQPMPENAYFFIVGDGTEYLKLKSFVDEYKPQNFKLINRLAMDDFDHMIASCDVGMIFLDHRFTIPNFPSRLLSYMQAGLPVLACTDPNTDVGKVITNGGFGWWCESSDPDNFIKAVNDILNEKDYTEKSKKALEYLKEEYLVDKAYDIIIK
jgi:glycosyltransferase involved in cell wall biosynthesis